MDIVVILYLFATYRIAKRHACPGRTNAVILSIALSLIWFTLGLFVKAPFYFPIISFVKLSLFKLGTYLFIMAVVSVANVYYIRWARAGADYQGLMKSVDVSPSKTMTNKNECPAAEKITDESRCASQAWVKPIVITGQVLWEEILYRGLLFFGVALLFGATLALTVQALLFAYMHYFPLLLVAKSQDVAPGRYIYSSLVFITLASGIFMYFNIVFHALWPGWLMHSVLNYVADAKGRQTTL